MSDTQHETIHHDAAVEKPQEVNEVNNNHKPSAPPADENGFIVVPQQPLDSAVENVINTIASNIAKEHDEVTKQVDNLVPQAKKEEPAKKESAPAKEEPKKESAAAEKPKAANSCTKTGCTACPYYLLGFSCLKNVQLPPKVQDLILWKDPKFTGAIFGTSLVLLISLAIFSLFTVVGTFLLLALTAAGAYRLYLSLLFRIKGVQDDTFERLSTLNLSIPKDKFNQLSGLIESDINNTLNKLKSIILWDNIVTSSLAFLGFYFVYCIGSVFNTLTLIIIGLVSVFTLPLIYHVYQKQIDQALHKAAEFSHNIARQVSAKLPFLHKKKAE